jgi:hypothetical protein
MKDLAGQADRFYDMAHDYYKKKNFSAAAPTASLAHEDNEQVR